MFFCNAPPIIHSHYIVGPYYKLKCTLWCFPVIELFVSFYWNPDALDIFTWRGFKVTCKKISRERAFLVYRLSLSIARATSIHSLVVMEVQLSGCYSNQIWQPWSSSHGMTSPSRNEMVFLCSMRTALLCRLASLQKKQSISTCWTSCDLCLRFSRSR